MQDRFCRIGVLALACAAAACGPFRRGANAPDPVVFFHNQSLDQADVFAVRSGGNAIRIGTVFAGRREALRVPLGAAGDRTVNIVARILATSRAPRTGQITLAPGDSVEVTLSSDEKMLSVLPIAQR